MTRPTTQERFWSNVKRTATCWLWTGTLDRDGYGKMMVKGHNCRAHRLVYEWVKGEIPNRLPLDHICRVRNCVNPDHLEPVTVRENTLRGIAPSAINARKTVCHNGHEFTPENTYIRPDAPMRNCRKCRADAVARYRERKAAS
jgi:hypothetical protein